MFIVPKEMETKLYAYQLEQITGGDEALVTVAIEAAIEETSSYLSRRYNVEKIFEAIGDKRNAHLLDIVKTIAVWKIIQLSNVDMLYDKVAKEYEQAINWLNRVSRGFVNPNLPKVDAENVAGFDIISDKKNDNNY
jgi:phage gp36-like protein